MHITAFCRSSSSFKSSICADSKASGKMADEKVYLEKSVETLENGSSLTPPVDHQAGSVQLLDSDHVVLVPTPSQDPKGE